MLLIIAFTCTFLISLALTPVVRRVAHRFGRVAPPRKDRWHTKPTALFGGIAIFSAFLIGYLAFAPRIEHAHSIFLSATFLFITGLVDDLIQIKPHTKLIAQVIAASALVYSGAVITWAPYAFLNHIITIFWLVAITNAVNLLDNMDGLAGGISTISCVFLVITFLTNGQLTESLIPALLAGAVLGFLVFNFNPASIFMGDCGSMFLGFLLGGMALLSHGQLRSMTAALLAPVLLLLIPIFDTCLVTVTRKLSGRRISQGGRDHVSHRLVALGLSERRTVILLYLLATASSALASTLRVLRPEMALTFVAGFSLVFVFFGLYLGEVRVYELGQQPAGMSTIRVLFDFSHKRRIFEILLDIILVALAYHGAYLLRWDGDVPPQQFGILLRTVSLVILIHLFFFYLFGVYRGLWRYAGIDDLIVIAKAVIVSMATSMAVILTIYHFRGPSRGVFIVNALLLFFFVGASRLSFRLIGALISSHAKVHSDSKPVLIYGAGDRGELLIRELHSNPQYHCAPIGFIDDDERKCGRLLHGCPIFGSGALPDLIHKHSVSEVWISSSKVPESRLDSLRTTGVRLKRMRIDIE
jgi:UDP-GlcNAc:undecaprenyl-phosphate GlcNAc-1-phosphate transferase